MRPWLVLTHAGATFETETVELPHMTRRMDEPEETLPIAARRKLGSVNGLFPVLRVDGVAVHESLAICEYVAEAFPESRLWPEDSLSRAQARAACSEMVSGFRVIRNELSSHLFARVPGFTPSREAKEEIDRVFELFGECLERSGGPFLFGRFGITDAMYYPMLGRFRTYGVALPGGLEAYAAAVDRVPAVAALVEAARSAPRLVLYDRYVRLLGGDPDAALAAA
jgi:glutathione S-transferase